MEGKKGGRRDVDMTTLRARRVEAQSNPSLTFHITHSLTLTHKCAYIRLIAAAMSYTQAPPTYAGGKYAPVPTADDNAAASTSSQTQQTPLLDGTGRPRAEGDMDPDDFKFGVTVEQSSPEVRQMFLKKVSRLVQEREKGRGGDELGVCGAEEGQAPLRLLGAALSL